MRQLGLPRPELPKSFSNRLTLHTPLYPVKNEKLTEKGVELLGASADPLDLLSLLHDLQTTLIAILLDLGSRFVDLLCLLFSDPLDVQHVLLSARR